MSHNNVIKRLIKRSIQIFAAKFGPHSRTHSQPKLLILMYHRILPLNDERVLFEEPGMIVTPDTLKMNLEVISEYFEFVKLSEWIEKKQKGLPLPDKACAITFDDGWVDNYQFAYPILREMNIPASIFLVSDMIGSDAMFWPERLTRTIVDIAIHQPQQWNNSLLDFIVKAQSDYEFSNIPPSREQLSQIIAHSKQYTDQEIHKRLDNIEMNLSLQNIPKDPSLLNWEQVTEMTESGLIEIGSHTCNHIRLNSHTPKKVIENEIKQSKIQIEKHTKLPVNTFCFPNGDYSDDALAFIKTQYDCAVTTKNGWNSSQSDHYKLQRIGLHEDIANDKVSFLARISGWI